MHVLQVKNIWLQLQHEKKYYKKFNYMYTLYKNDRNAMTSLDIFDVFPALIWRKAAGTIKYENKIKAEINWNYIAWYLSRNYEKLYWNYEITIT